MNNFPTIPPPPPPPITIPPLASSFDAFSFSSDDENGKVYVVKSISTKTSGSANIRIIAPADQRIDSETQIFIESPFGAVNLVVCSGSVEGRFYSIF